jgi:hypothetical protein
MEWTKHELAIISSMLRDGSSIEEVANILKRSRPAVVRAAQKIMFQALLFHGPHEVAKMYGFQSVDEFRDAFGSDKYYIEPRDDVTVPSSILMILGLLVASGVARFGMVLAQSPLLRQC